MAIADNIVAYWKLNESSGNAADEVGSNTGTVNGATQGATGKISTGYDFDGASDYINVGTGNILSHDTAITISAWISPDNMGQGNYGRIVFRRNSSSSTEGISFNLDGATGTNRIWFIVEGSTDVKRVSNDNAVSTGVYQHVVATWDGTTTATGIHIYVNGSEVTYSTTQNGATLTSCAGQTTYIGQRGDGNREFDGKIDEVGIWERALTSSEVTKLYNSGNGLTYPFSNIKINISDDWKEVDAIKVNIDDDWKEVIGIKINISDDWKTVF